MTTRKQLFLFALIATTGLATTACSGLAKVDVGTVLTSGRDGWQHPDQVIEALQIAPGDRVAEVGAGNGYWIRRLAEAVGPEGHVYAVEVEADLVSALEQKVADQGLENVDVVLGDYDDPRLPDGEIDLVMTCLTYHHIEDRPAYFRALQTDLSDRGRVAHLDDNPDSPAPLSWFQSEGHWSVPEQVVSEMGEAGYEPVASFDFLPAQSFSIFSVEGGGRAAGLVQHDVAPSAR